MRKYIYILLFITTLVSCQSAQNEREMEWNNLMIKSTKEFVAEDGWQIEEEYGSIKDFKNHYLKTVYAQDTLYVQAIQYVNACGNAIAWIEINGDTLKVTTKEMKDELCASGNWCKYEYWIKNPKKRKFILSQE